MDTAGRITLRYRGRLHHIGIGNAYAGWRVAMLIDGHDIEIVGSTAHRLRASCSTRPRTISASPERTAQVYAVSHVGLRCLEATVRPRKDSNLRTRFRKPMLFPLSYGGVIHTSSEWAASRRGAPTLVGPTPSH